MKILVCVKRVPNNEDNEIELDATGKNIDRESLDYTINEWDNYAVEEAIRLAEDHDGTVTVVTVGDEESEEILRRELAMGANSAILVHDEQFDGSDGRGIATILKSIVDQNEYDLILTGAQAEAGEAQVGGMLAAMLDRPFASLVNKIEADGENTLEIGRETEGGKQEIYQIDMPCVLSVQTGINEPRYVSIRGIRKTASIEIPTLSADDLGIAAELVGEENAKIKKQRYFIPEATKNATMLTGSRDENVQQVFEMVKAKGGMR